MSLFINPLRQYKNILRGLNLCFVMGTLVAVGAGCQTPHVSNGLELQSEDYSKARSHFQTHLIRHEPAPQQWTALQVPADVLQVTYSESPSLTAWLSPPDNQNVGQKQPAVLFLHGGFAFGGDDWEMTKPYRDAGYVVMTPTVRGENGQAGDYSMFYDEVQDVVAAADYLAKLPYVDPKRLYVAGHSVGGTLTLLSAMTTTRFRAAASFSGSPDQIAWSKDQPEVIPFDSTNLREFQMRSPVAFATSFKCPVRLYYGNLELLFGGPSQRTAELARTKHLDVEAISVSGNHFTAVSEEIQKSIQFFQTKN